MTERRWSTGALGGTSPAPSRGDRQGAFPVRPDASFALPGAQPLAIEAQVRYVSPEEDEP